jgi:hypothetical protein
MEIANIETVLEKLTGWSGSRERGGSGWFWFRDGIREE